MIRNYSQRSGGGVRQKEDCGVYALQGVDKVEGGVFLQKLRNFNQQNVDSLQP